MKVRHKEGLEQTLMKYYSLSEPLILSWQGASISLHPKGAIKCLEHLNFYIAVRQIFFSKGSHGITLLLSHHDPVAA
jgi:hypothetical protein